jgi:hypothetical protein
VDNMVHAFGTSKELRLPLEPAARQAAMDDEAAEIAARRGPLGPPSANAAAASDSAEADHHPDLFPDASLPPTAPLSARDAPMIALAALQSLEARLSAMENRPSKPQRGRGKAGRHKAPAAPVKPPASGPKGPVTRSAALPGGGRGLRG